MASNEMKKAKWVFSFKKSKIYFNEYFEELKRQVDLRREELKLKLDNYSDEIIQSIESTKDNCHLCSEPSCFFRQLDTIFLGNLNRL